MENYLNNTDRFERCVGIMNRVIIPNVTSPVEIQFIYVNGTAKELPTKEKIQIPHHHSYFEIHFPLRSELYYRFQNNYNTVTVENDQYIVISPQVEHHRINTPPSMLKISFGIRFTHHSNDGYSARMQEILSATQYFMKPQTNEMRQILARILADCENATFFSPYIIRDHLICLLLEICNSLHPGFAALQTPTESVINHRIERVKQFIQDNLDSPLRTNTVAAHVYISAKQLNRIFTEQEGISVSRYISGLKLSRAVELLTTTDFMIKKIAYMLGFENETTFTVFFKKHTELSPSEYRKAFQQGDSLAAPKNL
ncbi:MAG: helix-turn-helix transcriptional regulator [Ruminococcaceae bacterium]|nr:helix-turn-helix transcriptional regulator [Oscillospiraceae bacterium]